MPLSATYHRNTRARTVKTSHAKLEIIRLKDAAVA